MRKVKVVGKQGKSKPSPAAKAAAPLGPGPKPRKVRAAPIEQQPTAAGVALRGLGGAGASALGAYFGVPPSLTAPIGTALGAGVSRLLGQGDYEVKSNSLLAPGSSHLNSATVMMGPDGRRGIRVQEREFIGIVVSSTTFANTSFLINPANATTFPWLSTIAQNFDEWEPNGIAFSYKSTSAAFNGTNQALGVVIGATDYDVADANYFSRIEMESSAYCVSSKAADDWVHLIECDVEERGRRVLKCLAGASYPANTSAMDYVLGKFQVATDGQSVADMVLGELWVSYDITFYKKQLFNGQLGFGTLSCFNYWTDVTGVSSTAPFCTVAPGYCNGNIAISFNAVGSKFKLEGIAGGCFEVLYSLSGVAGVNALSATWTLVNCSFVPAGYLTSGSAATGTHTSIGTAMTRYTTGIYIRVTAPNPVITLATDWSGWSSVATIRLNITQINGLAVQGVVTPGRSTF
jgi:hypothetical protein